MILVIDNYDSFTYNLVQYLGELGASIEIVRNNVKSVAELLQQNPTHIILSPGPCSPNEAGVTLELIEKCPSHLPILGVCLGHQALGAAFGGKVIRAPYPMHGKTDTIHLTTLPCPLFQGLPSTFTATRYHSLIVDRESLPNSLLITATTSDQLIMGLQHKTLPRFGLQFHPESILTEHGKKMLQNFLTFQVAQ